MAAVNADIKPNGLNQRDLVDLMYQLTSSLVGIAAKIDADEVSTDYTAAVNALLNCQVEDSQGNAVRKAGTESSTVGPFYSITPSGLTNEALLEWMYQWTAAWRALCAATDAGGAALSTYVANAYTAIMTDRIVNRRGETTGSGTDFTFNAVDKRGGQLVDWLYDAVDAVETFTEQLDGEGTMSVNYEALWFTNNITLTVQNSAGNSVGN